MPTDVQKFSTGYKGKKPRRTSRPRRNRVAEHQGRTPQPSVPQGPRNSTKTERRNRDVAKSLRVKPLRYRPETAAEKAEKKRQAAAVAILRKSHLGRSLHPKAPTVATASIPSRVGVKGPSHEELLELAVDKDVVKPLQAEGKLPKHKTLGQDIYQKVAEYGPLVITEAPAAAEGARGLLAVARGARAGEDIVGGSKLLSKVLKPTEATSAADRAAVAERAAAKTAARESTGVKAAAKRAAAKVTRADMKADAAVARRVAGKTTRREAAAAAGAPLKAAKVTAAQSLPVVRGHERAVIHNPKKVAGTTLRAVPGLVAAPVGQVIGLGITGGRAVSQGAHELGIPGARGYTGKQILEPAENIGKEQLAFAKQVAKTLTAEDSAEVQKAVEDELGLTLPIALGLVGKAVGEKVTRGRVTDAVRTIVEQARSSVGKDHGRHGGGQTPRVFERSGQRKREAVRAANAKARVRREQLARSKKIRREAGKAKGSEVVRRGVARRGRFVRRSGDLEVHAGDIVKFAVRHSLPLDKPADAVAEVKRIRSSLKPLPEGARLPADKLSTRDLIAFVEKNPKVLADKHVRREVEAARGQARYSREHADELEPEHSETARFTPTAITRDIPLKQERFPQSVRDVVRAEPNRGRLAKDVLRRESRSDRSRAKRLGRKAGKREERARIIDRELSTRAGEPLAVDDRAPAAVRVKERRLSSLRDRSQRLRGELGMRERAPKTAGGDLRQVVARRRAELLDTEAEIRGIEAELPGMVGRHQDAAVKAAEDARAQRQAAAEAKGSRLGAQAQIYRRGAARAAEAATRKHHAATEVDPALEREFTGEVEGRLRAEGKPMPEYTDTRRARGISTTGVTAAKVSKFPGRSHFRKGTAEEYGMVEEGLAPYLRESIARPISRRESFKAMRGFLAENEYRDGVKSEFTQDEAEHLFSSGKLSRDNYVLVPRQDYKRTFSPEEWAAHLKLAVDDDPEAAAAPGTRYKVVRRAAAKEFADQMAGELFSTKLAKVNRVTSYLILGTSPAWAAAQIVAEYAQGAAAQPKILNPAYVRKVMKAYKAMAPHERQAFDSWVGVTARELTSPGDLKMDLKTGDMAAASDAYSVMNRTPLGRLIRSIPRGLHDLDQWKGGRLRVLTAASKIDHDFNMRGGQFLRGVRGLYDEIGKASAALKGKPLEEQLAFVSSHPEFERRYQGYLDDVMGNWSALTHNERLASQLAIFYPFLRMSLRWTFYAFPKHHPIKAAALYYLGQQNANALKSFLGQNPSYFTEWANVPLKIGPHETIEIPLSRIAPGGNTLVEAAGEAKGIKGVGLRLLQPAIAAAIQEETGVNPMTGKQEENSAAAALASILHLPSGVRVADEATTPEGQQRVKNAPPIFGSTERQESLDKLFDKLGEVGTTKRAVRTLGVPILPKNAEYTRDLTRLRAILDTLSGSSSSKRQDLETAWAYKHEGGGRKEIDATLTAMEAKYERANNALDRLLVKYKIPHVAEEEAGGQRYDEIHYGAKPNRGSTSFGGAVIATPEKGGPAATGTGVSTFGGKAAGGPAPKASKEPRFYKPKSKASTFGGKPAG